MTAERVDAVIAAVARHDPKLAGWMRTAADALTAGEGEEIISQASLQVFLWYEQPRKYLDDTWRPLTEATGVLLSLLGLDGYAAIARSSTTAAILEAWREVPSKGFARFRAARSASGVQPPDTDLLEWGEIMGMEEAAALSSVELALERAIESGDLRPGTGSWRRVAADICGSTLLRPSGAGADRTLLAAVLDERSDTWVSLARPASLKVWREKARVRAAAEMETSDVAATIAPMRWLLETCRTGIALTQAGYLPPGVVREVVGRFGWWPFRGHPRSEVDVHQLGVLRDTAARLRLVSKRSGRLSASARGMALIDDPIGLWRLIAATLACEDDYVSMLSEFVAHRLLDGPALDGALERDLGPIVAAQGWIAGDERITPHAAGLAVHRALYHWRLFGLLDEVRPKWEGGRPTGPNITALNAAGRAAATAFLRARASVPRTDLRA